MIISQKGLDLIKHYEGFEPRAYICPTGHLTIGYGTVIDTPSEQWLRSEILTVEKAEQLLATELGFYEEQVYKLVPKTIHQYQFDALLSFSYNLGVNALKNSTLLKIIKANGDPSVIESEFRKWCHGNGEVLPGLQKRRNSEAILFNTGVLKFF